MYFASPPPLLSTSASLMGTTEDERVGNAKEGERKQDAERERHGERNIDDINTRGNGTFQTYLCTLVYTCSV